MFFETPESPRMFKSDFFDFFSRVHYLTVPILFVPVTVYCVVHSVVWAGVSVAATLGLFVAGFVAWTLSEYWLHRTFFHWQPATWWGPKLHFFVHGVHHDWPNDRYRLVMPPAVSVGLLVLVAGPAFLFGLGAWGWAALGGFVCGYMNYDLTHYYIHHAKPKWPFYKRLKAHHMNHHFNKDGRKYGVSTMIWDRVFGTN